MNVLLLIICPAVCEHSVVAESIRHELNKLYLSELQELTLSISKRVTRVDSASREIDIAAQLESLSLGEVQGADSATAQHAVSTALEDSTDRGQMLRRSARIRRHNPPPLGSRGSKAQRQDVLCTFFALWIDNDYLGFRNGSSKDGDICPICLENPCNFLIVRPFHSYLLGTPFNSTLFLYRFRVSIKHALNVSVKWRLLETASVPCAVKNDGCVFPCSNPRLWKP